MTLEALKRNKKAFVFGDADKPLCISFYQVDGAELSPIDSLVYFDYLKEFVDAAIEKKEKAFQRVDLSNDKDQFIMKNVEQIIKSYEEKDCQAEEQIDKLKEERRIRGNTLQKLRIFEMKNKQ